MRRSLPLVLATVLLAGCGGGGGGDTGGGGGSAIPAFGSSQKGSETAAQTLGFPYLATKNTTRVSGADPTNDAAGVARAVFPAVDKASRPTVVALVDSTDFGGALAASVLAGPPVKAAILFSQGSTMPAVSSITLKALKPTGSAAASNAEVIRVGDVATPGGFNSTDIIGHDPITLAAAVDRFQIAASGQASREVMVTSADEPAYAMPAAAYAAKSGTPILLVTRDEVPAATRGALGQHGRPRIYVVGPPSVVSSTVVRKLRAFGTVERISGNDPVANSIAFARYRNGTFGWNVRNPGHGLVFASASRPLDAIAGGPLSDSGTYGPLVLLTQSNEIPPALADYLVQQLKPAYDKDPTFAFYNHGWLLGDETAITVRSQAEIDRDLEIVPVSFFK